MEFLKRLAVGSVAFALMILAVLAFTTFFKWLLVCFLVFVSLVIGSGFLAYFGEIIIEAWERR